jgi:hypothetical protein
MVSSSGGEHARQAFPTACWRYHGSEDDDVGFCQGERAKPKVPTTRKVRVEGHALSAGDGVTISDASAVKIEGIDRGLVLAFDLG